MSYNWWWQLFHQTHEPCMESWLRIQPCRSDLIHEVLYHMTCLQTSNTTVLSFSQTGHGIEVFLHFQPNPTFTLRVSGFTPIWEFFTTLFKQAHGLFPSTTFNKQLALESNLESDVCHFTTTEKKLSWQGNLVNDVILCHHHWQKTCQIGGSCKWRSLMSPSLKNNLPDRAIL